MARRSVVMMVCPLPSAVSCDGYDGIRYVGESSDVRISQVVCDLSAEARVLSGSDIKINYAWHDRDLRLLSISITALSVAYDGLQLPLSSPKSINFSSTTPSASGPLSIYCHFRFLDLDPATALIMTVRRRVLRHCIFILSFPGSNVSHSIK